MTTSATHNAPAPRLSVPAGAPFVKVSRTIACPAAKAFAYIVPVDLTHIFPAMGDMPGIAATTVPTGWGHAGQTRHNTATDGSTHQETLTSVEPPVSFAYRIENFSAPELNTLIDHVEGGWLFTDNGNDTTSIDWIYSFVPRNSDAKAQIESQLLRRYRAALDNALSILKSDLEK